jgi:hypothetical protein
MDEALTVIKRGEIVVQATLRRTISGLSISVKAAPAVETFMKSLGSGESQDVKHFGRYWDPTEKGGKLEVYSLGINPGAVATDNGSFFRIDMPGTPIIAQSNGVSNINLSFLRLVGISEGAGVMFGIKGVYSLDSLRDMKDHIGIASRKFYLNYLRPIDLTVQISTQEMLL